MNSIRSGGGSGLRVGSGIGGPLLRSYFAAAGWQFPSSFGGCPSALLEDALEDVFGAPCKSSCPRTAYLPMRQATVRQADPLLWRSSGPRALANTMGEVAR